MNSITIDRSILESFAGERFDRFHALIDYIDLKRSGKKLSYRELATRWGWKSTKTAFDFAKKIEGVYSPTETVGETLKETLEETPISASVLGLSGVLKTAKETLEETHSETLPTENGVSSQYNNARLPYVKEIHPTDKEPNPTSVDLYNGSLSSGCKESAKKTPDRNKIPPTVEMVRKYCEERQNGIDPEQFVDFYTSKNWMIGKNKMKDWESAVRTWEKDPRRKRETQTAKPVVKPNQFNTGIYERGSVDWDTFAKQNDALGAF